MSASQIPNLLTSRGGPRSRGGGRGHGRGQPHAGPSHLPRDNDLDIQGTDTDAAVSRLSAVNLGYLSDPYASYFVSGPGTRRLPVINRGTYSRTTALDILINAFLSYAESSAPQTKQIISLGAGTDTRYFRLRSQNKHQNLIYHEFDFPSVCKTKWETIRNNALFAGGADEYLFPLSSAIGTQASEKTWGFKRSKDGTTETIYCCHPLDLRQLPAAYKFQLPPGLRTNIPTLIISECCLCYLDVDISRNVISWFVNEIPSLGIVLYEPIGVDDSFGQTMVANLAKRNITMPSLRLFKTLQDQKLRLSDLGFSGQVANSGQDAETIEKVWDEWVPAEEKKRVDRLEGLDEVEEWQMLARHYAVVWGWKGTTGWEGWAGLRNK